MDKLEELKKLKDLLENNVIDESEFNSLKDEILGKETTPLNSSKEISKTKTNIHSNSEEEVKSEPGLININFPGQFFLFDAKTKLFINGALHSTHSTKKGFSVDIPLKSSELEIKVVLAGVKSTKYNLSEIDINTQYSFTLQYSTSLGKYSKDFKLSENGKG